MNGTPGQIIVLNGASSAGKSSIVKALQEILDEPYLEAGIDKFLWMLPHRYLNTTLWQEVFAYTWHETDGAMRMTIKAGPQGRRLISGMHHAVAALSRSGNNVLVDHVLLEPEWVTECAALFIDLPAVLVGVMCPLPVLKAREKARGDRTLGQAAAYHDAVHQHGVYDLTLNTSDQTAVACAVRLERWLASGSKPTAFEQIRICQNSRTPNGIANGCQTAASLS